MRTTSVGEGHLTRLRALEVPLEVSAHGAGAAALASAIDAAWDRCLDNDSGEPAHRLRLILEDDEETLAASRDGYDLAGTRLAGLMDRLSPTITRLALAERAGSLVLVHACALADPVTGDTVVLFGPSGTGKTTVARTLGSEFAYLTDETAGIDGSTVLPYPKPLSILTEENSAVKEQVSPTQLGLRQADGPFGLRALVQLYRDPGHRGAPLVDELDTMEALVELVSQTSYSRQMERPLHRLADLTKAVGGVRRVTYAEAADLVPVVRSLIDGRA